VGKDLAFAGNRLLIIAKGLATAQRRPHQKQRQASQDFYSSGADRLWMFSNAFAYLAEGDLAPLEKRSRLTFNRATVSASSGNPACKAEVVEDMGNRQNQPLAY